MTVQAVAPIIRLMYRCVETPGPLPTACWIPTYARTHDGYTRIYVGQRKSRKCHLVAYEAIIGPIPDGLQIDHLCRERACCNPGHLEPVTSLENTRRGNSPSALACRTNTCRNGHSMDDAYVFKLQRRCRACFLEYQRERRRLYREVAA